MPRTETYGTRSMAWSIFHRSMPSPAYMIDMDYLECCRYCKQPLLIGELAQDIGQSFKATTILLKLAEKANIPGVLIFYDEDAIIQQVKLMLHIDILSKIPKFNNEELKHLWQELSNIEKPIFRLCQIFPHKIPERKLTALEYFIMLEKIHSKHEDKCLFAQNSHPLLRN